MSDVLPPRPTRPHPLEQRPPSPALDDDHDAAPPPARAPRRAGPTPWITYVLVAVNVAIFVLGFLLPDQRAAVRVTCRDGATVRLTEVGDPLQVRGWNSGPRIFCDNEWWRMATAMFLHGSPAHIFFNAYALVVFGAEVERLFGRARFLIVYILGGLCGSLLSAALGTPTIPSVGASGAVFALLGAQIVFLLRARPTLGDAGNAALRQLAFLAALNLGLGFIPGSRIDNLGHIGGFLGGLALAVPLAPRFRVTYTMEGYRAGARLSREGNWQAIAAAGTALFVLAFALAWWAYPARLG